VKMGKQVVAALALVASLGLVMPSAFGGSASADPVPAPGGRTEEPRWFYCDSDRNGSFETPYHVVSQANDLGSFHVLDSSTILAYSYDVRVEVNVPFSADIPAPAAPDGRVGTVTTQTDPPRQNGRGNHNGKFAQAVGCHEAPEGQPDAYTYVEDITACCPPLEKDVQYRVFGNRYWYVTVTGTGQGPVKSGGGKHQHHSRHHRH
jgi:hypothetical protein